MGPRSDRNGGRQWRPYERVLYRRWAEWEGGLLRMRFPAGAQFNVKSAGSGRGEAVGSFACHVLFILGGVRNTAF